MKNEYDIVKSLVRTEKGTEQLTQNKYLFWVARDANKIEIRQSVEKIYKVSVKAVNTMFMRGKKKRVRHVLGKTPDWKKAIVTLAKGQKIDLS